MMDGKLEKAYESLCSMILDGNVPADSLCMPPAAVDNLFYERFGMSFLELAEEMERQKQEKLQGPIDIATEFH